MPSSLAEALTQSCKAIKFGERWIVILLNTGKMSGPHMPKFTALLKKHQKEFHPIVPFNPATEKIISLDLTGSNNELTEDVYSDTKRFSEYLDQKRKSNSAKFLVGGYNELREVYRRSPLFDFGGKYDMKGETPEPRRLHLGIDIWGEEGTKIYAPFGGMIYSFAFNNNSGDYGATIILSHQLESISFYTLYGHLSLRDLASIHEGYYIIRGQEFAHFGNENENGQWPPHLHFQVIQNMGMYKGDYPGVCNYTERKYYLKNSPDPNSILNLNQYL
jgi:murein DD-endopeptidase MepM/ murein hydrolase activator NlpD